MNGSLLSMQAPRASDVPMEHLLQVHTKLNITLRQTCSCSCFAHLRPLTHEGSNRSLHSFCLHAQAKRMHTIRSCNSTLQSTLSFCGCARTSWSAAEAAQACKLFLEAFTLYKEERGCSPH